MGERTAVTIILTSVLILVFGLTAAAQAVSSSEVVQIQTLDIELELHDSSTCEDYIAAYDGDYSCEAGTTKTLSVGPNPVLYHFQHDNSNTNVCQWRFEPQGSQRLVLTGVEFSGLLPCDEGYLALHDELGGKTECGLRMTPSNFGVDLLVIGIKQQIQDPFSMTSTHFPLNITLGNHRGTCARAEGCPPGCVFSYCVMRYEFEAEKGNHPLVHFEGHLNWPGSNDIITVYDGESIHDPVIYVLNETGFFQNKWVVGSKQKMMVEITAGATQGRGHVELKAQSSPVGQAADLCIQKEIDMHATSTPQNISSVNYPGFFLADNLCHYLISTKTKGDVVHLEILEAAFGYNCDSRLTIYNGDSKFDDKLGMVCHGNPGYATKFESLDSDMLVAFVSGKSNYGDRWKVQYYSAPPTPPIDDEPEDDHTAAIVGGVLGAIIVILLIIIIWCAVTRRRSDSAAI